MYQKLPEVGTYHNPVFDALQSFGVKDEILQASQRPVGIHPSALVEHVAVATEVVAWGPCVAQNISPHRSNPQTRELISTQKSHKCSKAAA